MQVHRHVDEGIAFIDDLTKTLDKFKVPEREKGEVLAAFRSMQADVVENP